MVDVLRLSVWASAVWASAVWASAVGSSAVAALAVLPCVCAEAQSTPVPPQAQAREGAAPVQPSEPIDSVAQEPLTKDWAVRKLLAEDGIDLVGHFIAEPAANVHGYKGAGFAYAQQVDFGAVIDLRKLAGFEDGTVRILLSDRAGRGLQQDNTGAYIQGQAFYGQGMNFRLDEIDYDRSFLDKRLDLKGGFYSMGNDFAGLSYTCNFSNNGNCGHPLGLLYDSGWVDSPTGQWGVRAKWTDPSGWYAETGIYDVTPLRKSKPYGFSLDFKATTGAIAAVETGYVHGRVPADYPGTYKIGAYYDTSVVTDVAEPSAKVNGREGGYIEAGQQIWKPDPDRVAGLAVFGVATLGDPQTGLFRTSYEAGASWLGPFRGRASDIVSLGWVELDVNSRLRAAERAAGKPTQSEEQIIEVNYGAQLAPWLLVRPTVQYVLRPGAYDTRPDTFVFVLHIQATL